MDDDEMEAKAFLDELSSGFEIVEIIPNPALILQRPIGVLGIPLSCRVERLTSFWSVPVGRY